MGYELSADYVDSTTAYDPRPGLDPIDNGSLMANVVTTGRLKSFAAVFIKIRTVNCLNTEGGIYCSNFSYFINIRNSLINFM